MRRNALIGLAASLAMAAGASSALAQVGTAFTYQGQLKNSGAAVGTPTDLQFSLWNAAAAGTQVGSTITQTNVAVTAGLFTSSLDFGVNPYTADQALYLQIAVRNPAGSGSYVAMGTRQRLTAAPFSMATRGVNVDGAGAVAIGSAASAGLLKFARGGDGATASGFLGWLTPTDATTFRLANFSGGGVLRLESNAATVFNRSTDGAEMARITSAGNFGIGINVPGSTLDVVGNGPIVPGSSAARAIRAQSLQPWGSCIGIDSSNLAGGKRWDLFASGGVASEGQGKLIFRNDTDNVSAVVVTPTGTVGIGPGILTPLNILDVRRPNAATGDVISFGSLTYAMGRLGEDSNTNAVTISNIYPTNPTNTSIEFRVGGSTPANTKARVRGDGVFEVKTLQINGGSDLVEGFDSQAANVEPGTLMVIDPEHPGQLMPSTSAYDSRVAGVVSGAGGVKPGIHMGQDGVLDGKTPIAMTGRVYVRCTAAGGAIKPGDLLTTSDLAGCAMKVCDRSRAPGATIGKAMSSLDEGSGLVLVLVNLQ